MSLLIGLTLFTACSNNSNKEMEAIQQKIDDAGFNVQTGLTDDNTAYIYMQFPSESNQAFFITLKEGNEEVNILMHAYDSSDGIMTYRSFYFPEDNSKTANLKINDTEVCPSYDFETGICSDCLGGDNTIEYMVTVNDLMETKLGSYDLDYHQLVKWAPWSYQNNN